MTSIYILRLLYVTGLSGSLLDHALDRVYEEEIRQVKGGSWRKSRKRLIVMELCNECIVTRRTC